MCRRKSKAMSYISAMCIGQNMDPDQLFEKSKLLLSAYRRVCWASLGTLQRETNDDCFICDVGIGQALENLDK